MSDFAFCPELATLLAAKAVVGKTGKRFESLGSVSTRNNLLCLRRLFLHRKPRRTLEIGLAFGGSALLFTACHREAGLGASRQHTAIDPFQTSFWDSAGLLAVQNAGLAGYLELRERPSCLELPAMLEAGQQFDLAYIDGSHMFEDVFVDFYYVRQMITADGIIAFDDCSTPQVAKVIRFIRKNMVEGFTEVDLSPFLGAGRKSLKYAIARRLGRVQMVAFRRCGPTGRLADGPFHDF